MARLNAKKKKFSSYILQKLLAINNVQIASLVSPQINIMQTNIMPVKKKKSRYLSERYHIFEA